MKSKEFEVCVRAIIRYRGKTLVCYHRKKRRYFFPGGHIKFGESINEALKREIKEELNIFVKKFSFIGMVDNIYREEGKEHHEINFVFDTKTDRITEGREIEETKGDHISFILFDKKRFSKERVLPIALRESILKWLKNRKMFWASQIYDKVLLKKRN